MPRRPTRPPAGEGGPPLLTLTELARRAGISAGTAHRYRQELGERLPSVGEGRTTRFPEEAVAILLALREEKAGRKGGRPPGRAPRPPAALAGEAPAGLLSLRRIGKLTGISYPTLLRYLARHGEQIPQVGSGRRRRFPPEAMAVFEALRASRGRRPRAAAGEKPAARPRRGGEPALIRRLQALEEAHAELTRQLRRLQQLLDRPWTVTVKRGRTLRDDEPRSPRRGRGGPSRAPEGEPRRPGGRRGPGAPE